MSLRSALRDAEGSCEDADEFASMVKFYFDVHEALLNEMLTIESFHKRYLKKKLRKESE